MFRFKSQNGSESLAINSFEKNLLSIFHFTVDACRFQFSLSESWKIHREKYMNVLATKASAEEIDARAKPKKMGKSEETFLLRHTSFF